MHRRCKTVGAFKSKQDQPQTKRSFVRAYTSTNLVLCFLYKEKALNLLTRTSTNLLTNLLTNRRFVLVLVRRFVLVLVRSAPLRFVIFVRRFVVASTNRKFVLVRAYFALLSPSGESKVRAFLVNKASTKLTKRSFVLAL